MPRGMPILRVGVLAVVASLALAGEYSVPSWPPTYNIVASIE